MQLRTRQQPSGAYCEVSSEEDEIDLEEPSPGQTGAKTKSRSGSVENAGAGPSSGQPKPKKSKAQRSKQNKAIESKRPELLSLVISTCGRQELFDTLSLRAIRATNKSLKDLIDSLCVLTHVKCKSNNLRELLDCLGLMDRMQQLTVQDGIDAIASTRLVLVNPPQLKELTIMTTGWKGEILLCGQFANLTSLTLNELGKLSFESLGTIPKWNLRRLSLSGAHCEVKKACLYNIIKRFPDLEEFKASCISIRQRRRDAEIDIQPLSIFQKLEKLELVHVDDLDNLQFQRLFRSAEESLPSVRSLTIPTNIRTVLKILITASKWIKNLDSLCLQHSRCGRLDVETDRATYGQLFLSLNGGTLRSLELKNKKCEKEEFKLLTLQHLTELKVGYYHRERLPDCLADICGASLPALRSLSVFYSGYNTMVHQDTPMTLNHVEGLAAAFPGLSSFSVSLHSPLHTDTCYDIGKHILPFVEELRLDVNNLYEDAFSSLTRYLREAGEGNFSSVLCPSLRVIVLSGKRGSMLGGTKCLNHMAQIAQHMPNLRRLILSSQDYSRDISLPTLKDALVGARPLLQELKCGSRAASALKGLWPLATIY